jgi:hypothetical protein
MQVFTRHKQILTEFFANIHVFSYISFDNEETPSKDDENIN